MKRKLLLLLALALLPGALNADWLVGYDDGCRVMYHRGYGYYQYCPGNIYYPYPEVYPYLRSQAPWYFESYHWQRSGHPYRRGR